jgi:hypothetical protein
MIAKNLAGLVLLFVLSSLNVSAQERAVKGNAPLDPWDITEIKTFHSLLHTLTSKYYQNENVDVLKEGYRQVAGAFLLLKEANLPDRFAGKEPAYQWFVSTVERAVNQYKRQLEKGDSRQIKEAFETVDEVFEEAIPLLRKRFNTSMLEKQ